MSDSFANALGAALVAFVFTNLDDLLVLVLLFGECKVEDVKRQQQKQQLAMDVINSQLDPEVGSSNTLSTATPNQSSVTEKGLRTRHVLVGQYIGFSLLVLVSLAGFLAGSFLPEEYIGLLGFVPILIGLYKLYQLVKDKCDDEEEEEENDNAGEEGEAQSIHTQSRARALGPSSAPERVSLTERQVRFHLDDEDSRIVSVLPVSLPRIADADVDGDQQQAETDSTAETADDISVSNVATATAPESPPSRWLALKQAVLKVLSPQTAKVCGITLANGADNISIYLALFASASGSQIGITLAVFYFMMAIWLAVSWALLKLPPIARAIGQYGEYIVPWALMGLGIYIMYEADCIRLVS